MTPVTVDLGTQVYDRSMIAIWIALGVAALLIASLFHLLLRIDALGARLDANRDRHG